MSFTGYFDAQILIITVEELCTLKIVLNRVKLI
jgi:hypothetical protein